MTGVEIAFIIVGIIFIIVSFFVQEKLSAKDMEEFAKLSEKELNYIVNRQMKNANERVEDSIEQVIEEAHEITKRAMEKESNEKIMAISEYSNTVIDSMNKTHDEILFLYSMLNDKHAELTGLASQLQQFSDHMRIPEPEMVPPGIPEPEPEMETEETQAMERMPVRQAGNASRSMLADDGLNHNEKILRLHQQGYTDVVVARTLGLGLGEVRLVIGLFRGEEAGEI